MALTFGFYDSINGDRTYNAEQFSRFFDGIISDGVIKAVGSRFQTTPGTNLAVKVGSGRAWFNHTWTYNDSDITVTLPAAHATLPRIDSIILVVDEQARTNSITYKQGTPASTPSAPALTNTETLHEYRIANVAIAATATSISSADITNVVGTNETPYATLSDMNIDYNTVANRPSINGILLSGNKTTANLNISYNDLTNKPTYETLSSKPSINGVTLSGNKTTANLNISYNDLTNKPALKTVATSGSYNDLTNKPTLNNKAISGSMIWTPGSLNSNLITITHSEIVFGTESQLAGDVAPVLRYTYTLPTPKNGAEIRRIAIGLDDVPFRSGNSHFHAPEVSSTTIYGQTAYYDTCDRYAIVTKCTSPISGSATYTAECYGPTLYDTASEVVTANCRRITYDVPSDAETRTEILEDFALYGEYNPPMSITANMFNDIRFGHLYWEGNTLHYAFQEYSCSSDHYWVSVNSYKIYIYILE